MIEFLGKLNDWQKGTVVFGVVGFTHWLYISILEFQRSKLVELNLSKLLMIGFLIDFVLLLVIGTLVGFLVNRITTNIRDQSKKNIVTLLIYILGFGIAYFIRLFILVNLAKPY